MRKVEAETRYGLAVPDSGQTCVLPCSVAILVLVLRRTEYGEVVRTAWWAGVSCMPHQAVVCCGHADRSDGAKHLVAYVGSLGGTLRPPPLALPLGSPKAYSGDQAVRACVRRIAPEECGLLDYWNGALAFMLYLSSCPRH